MIWQDPSETSPARNRIADRLLGQIPDLCGNPALVDSPILAEAASGVAAYLDQRRMALKDLTPARSCTLVAHALEAAGKRDLARRLRIFSTALVYRDAWAVTGTETVWVVDAGQLLMPADPRVEIVLFERLRSVLTSFADVWDQTRGHGIVGLKRLAESARDVLGPHARTQRITDLSAELQCVGGLHLDRLRVQRGWQATPSLLRLDPRNHVLSNR